VREEEEAKEEERLMKHARTISAAVAAVAIALLAVVPSGAAATKGKKKKPKAVPVSVVTASATTTADNQPTAATATCPGGTVAVGGGFSTETFKVGTELRDINVVYSSRRSAPGAWTVEAVREDVGAAGPPIALVASALCRTTKLPPKRKGKKLKKRKLTVAEASATSPVVAMNARASATATCPAGASAISGGFSGSPVPNLSGALPSVPFVFKSATASGKDWTASMTNRGPTQRSVTSHVYCATGLNIGQSAGSASLPAGASATDNPSATATTLGCAKGRSLLGGGFAFEPVNITAGPVHIVSESSPVAGTWRVGASSLAGPSTSFTASGLCG
jgi:hypothetical protein